jgi:hypothetical protein
MTVVFVVLELVLCDGLVVPCNGFFVVIRLLPHGSLLCQAATRERRKNSIKLSSSSWNLSSATGLLCLAMDSLLLFIFCHMTVIFVKLLPARVKKKVNKVVFVVFELVFCGFQR